MTHTLFTLDEVARRLRVQPATVRYWLRMLPRVLAVAVDDQGNPIITVEQLALLDRVRSAALDEGLSLHQIRQQLAQMETMPKARPDEELLAEVRALRAEVLFLSEESKELHRMLALLLQQFVLPSQAPLVAHPNGRYQASPDETRAPKPKPCPGDRPGTAMGRVSITRAETNATALSVWCPPAVAD